MLFSFIFGGRIPHPSFVLLFLSLYIFVVSYKIKKLDWVPPRSICDMMTIAYKGLGNSNRVLLLWKNACMTLIWVVRHERNARIF